MTGLILVSVSLIWFSTISAGRTYANDLLFSSILAGLGFGTVGRTLTLAAVSGMPRRGFLGLSRNAISTGKGASPWPS